MKKQKKLLIYILVFTSILLSSCKAFATDISNYVEEIKLSEDYIKYLELSNEEKEKVIAPRMYDIPLTQNTVTNPLKLVRMLGSTINTDYSLRKIIPENMKVKNQLSSNTCWAFSSLATLESNLALQDYKNKKTPVVYDFSERHMDYSTSSIFLDNKVNEYGFSRAAGSGGVIGMASAYLTNGLGAVNENEMPFEETTYIIDISEIQKEVVTQVNDIITFPSYSSTSDTTKIKQQMKEHIMNNGAIVASIHGANSSTNAYNSVTGAIYCNDSTLYPINHAVAIVGWDDKYGVENFVASNKPINNGAWIIKNSWGTGAGDNGFMYVSYEDVNIYTQLIGIENAQTEITYENIYQHDEFGGYIPITISNGNKIYLATIFDKQTKGTEYLTQVSINAPETYTCKVYVNPNGISKQINDLQQVQLKNGETETFDAGYHTIEFLKPLKINSDEFVVVLEIEGTRTNSISIMSEFNFGQFYTDTRYANSANHVYDNVTVENEKCFLSIGEKEMNANQWEDTSKFYTLTNGGIPNFDTTIKAFSTSNVLESIQITTPPTKTTYVEGQNFEKLGMVVEGFYGNGKIQEIEEYTIINGTELTLGQSNVIISYEDYTVNQPIEVSKNTVEKISIKSPATKTEYWAGEDFDTSGMIVEAFYKDGTIETVTDYIVVDGKALNNGQTTITISYQGQTTTMEIIVKSNIALQENIVEEKIITGITIKTMPSKLEYIQNQEELELAGGVIEISYNDESKEEILMTSKEITATGFDNKQVGKKSITLTYKGKTTQYDVLIKEAPQPENSNFNNMQAKIKRVRAYYYTDENQKTQILMNVELNNIIKSTQNDNIEYYYSLAANPNETNITNWVKLEQLKNINDGLEFEINTLDISNYEKLANVNTIYLYVKEVAIRNNMKKEEITIAVPLEIQDINIEEYIDGEKKTEVTPGEITGTTPGKEPDNTLVSGEIPKAGKSILIIALVFVVFVIGRLSYLRYKDIEIK